jgi:ATP-dependent DNA helicase RecQ
VPSKYGVNLSAALEILKATFGYSSFRGDQEKIISHVVNGGSGLVLMPTGGGKSLCYQVPALVLPGTTIVVSPLIALMENQVTALQEHGVQAAYLNSSLNVAEQHQVQAQLLDGDLKLLYVAPERLVTDEFMSLLERSQINLFAIDEAHCVSQWGHDFRKEYLQLSILDKRFPQIPRLALTATADVRTRDEIVTKLNLDGPVYVADFDRPNIQYRIATKNNPKKQLLDFLQSEHSDDSGIVYCMTRKKTEDVAKMLAQNGFNAFAYHAGMSNDKRSATQERFLTETPVIIVATIAFGMGIDKPDVRFVAHYDLSKNIEAYYQETGRAGRDGESATAWMIYGFQDVMMLRQMLEKSDADDLHKRVEQGKLDAFLGLCEATGCRRQLLLQYFGQEHHGQCGNCDLCLHPVKTFDGTIVSQKALSACFRTGQRFGANYLIDLLLGKSNERLLKFGHDSLPTYGVGHEFNAVQWKSVIRQLVALNYLSVDQEGYGGLKLAVGAMAVLKGQTKVLLHEDILHQQESKQRKKKAPAQQLELSDGQGELFSKLRELRQRLAKKAKVPPYMVFHDKTLKEIAQQRPDCLEDFSDISGVGEQKLKKYGLDFINVVRKHVL